jgi:hypothetical protein
MAINKHVIKGKQVLCSQSFTVYMLLEGLGAHGSNNKLKCALFVVTIICNVQLVSSIHKTIDSIVINMVEGNVSAGI